MFLHVMRRFLLPALLALALLAPAAAHAQTPPDPAQAMAGDTMWIWQVKKSSGGSVSRIARAAKRYGIENLVIKGADATRTWRQFNRGFVNALRARGLKVCAYQFVYGRRPRGEAIAGARIARAADCLVIDAETHYEGRYASAQAYLRSLRARIGPDYPLGLTSFPYVHYHPAFPYSVFLGPGGAQFNVPQAYWKAIGHSVDRTLATTYKYNSVYGREIAPLGQTWMHPRRSQIRRFRHQAAEYGAEGVGWWDWQESATRDWRAVSSLLPGARAAASVRLPRAQARLARRPGGLGPAAPARGRTERAGGRGLWLEHQGGRRRLPGTAGNGGRRRHRRRHLERAAAGRPRQGGVAQEPQRLARVGGHRARAALGQAAPAAQRAAGQARPLARGAGDRGVHRLQRRLHHPPVARRQPRGLERAQRAGALQLGRAVPGRQGRAAGSAG